MRKPAQKKTDLPVLLEGWTPPKWLPSASPCAWLTAGRRCLRVASSFDAQGPLGSGYCLWHEMVRDDNVQWAQNQREFERFLDRLLDAHPLYRRSVWGERNRERLWAECLGEVWSPPPSPRPATLSYSLPTGDRDA